ncbi:hypothetical protein JW758_04410 [Candidatus Peregrinibacteria bacterium]|nr:hypothetical protein [Candidatus Peregrinibacteria bacterium]
MKNNIFENMELDFTGQNRLVFRENPSDLEGYYRRGPWWPDGKNGEKGGDSKDGEGSTNEKPDASKNPNENPKDKTEDDLSTLKGNVEGAGEKKIIITEKDKDKFKKGMGKEIYGGDEKLREKYREGVREAIENMDKDRLYVFIQNHTPPKQKYNKGSHEEWNADFVEMIGPDLPSDLQQGADLPKEQRYIVGGLQQYLLDEFNTDVFQATAKKENPFIHVDGRLGGYTISVMAAHWNKKFKPLDKTNKSKLNYGSLGSDYDGKRRSQVLYNGAMAYLDGQLGIVSTQVSSYQREERPDEAIRSGRKTQKRNVATGAESAPSKSVGQNTKDKIRETLEGAQATGESLFAFESAYKKEYIPAIKAVIKDLRASGQFSFKNKDSWAEVHRAMTTKGSPHYNQQYVDAFKKEKPVASVAKAKPEKQAKAKTKEKAKSAEKTKTTAENLSQSDFVRRLKASINRSDFDFNTWNMGLVNEEDEVRESFAKQIYEVCRNYKLPTTTELIDRVVSLLEKHSGGKKVDYGRELFRMTDTQLTAQKAENRRLINDIARDLRKEYKNEKLINKEDESMGEYGFTVEMITELNERDIDFLSWGFEYNAREAFAKEAFQLCKKLKIPTSIRSIKEIVKVLQINFMEEDNDIKYYIDPDDAEEIQANDAIMAEIGRELKSKLS